MNKNCTSIEQSKKLIELGIDVNTADMCYLNDGTATKVDANSYNTAMSLWSYYYEVIPAWSLSALLELMPKETELLKGIADKLEDTYMCSVIIGNGLITRFSNTAVDAAFEMVVWLRENKKI